jgi:peptidoglycan lytic transglycosylase
MRGLALGVSLAALTASTGCLHRHRRKAQARRYPPLAPSGAPQPRPAATPPSAPAPAAPIVQGEEGIASWYGDPFNGRATSSGEIYNMYDMTAAHRTLPFGTEVRVHNLENGAVAVVRINDRGPFVDGRIIDLSYSAARALGIWATGTALVRLEILNPAVLSEPGVFAVQVGAFRDPGNAERLRDLIAAHYTPVVIQSFDRGDGLFHRVRVGRLPSEDQAQDLAREIREQNLATDTFVVRLN